MTACNLPSVELTAWFYGSLPPVKEVPTSDSSNWPVYVRHLVEEFGENAVWDASLQVLEFPPTWVWTAAEARRLEEFLRNQAA